MCTANETDVGNTSMGSSRAMCEEGNTECQPNVIISCFDDEANSNIFPDVKSDILEAVKLDFVSQNEEEVRRKTEFFLFLQSQQWRSMLCPVWNRKNSEEAYGHFRTSRQR